MKPLAKRALLVGAFLAGLCGALGLLIAGAELITRPAIEANRAKKQRDGLAKVFPSAQIGEGVDISSEGQPKLQKYWTVTLSDGEEARIYSASDRNAYGDVSLLIGIYGPSKGYALGNVVTLLNTESYGNVIQEKYLDAYNASEEKEGAVLEVRVGATFGAKMCRDMILSSQTHYKEGKR